MTWCCLRSRRHDRADDRSDCAQVDPLPPGRRCRADVGGENGKTGRYVLNPDTDAERIMPNKLSNYPIKAGDFISMQTPGGGYGDPAQRDPKLIQRDQIEGKMT